ncbi:MAG: putative hydrolase of the HAD superfamily, partial [Cyclobacteriaceae bacterium]
KVIGFDADDTLWENEMLFRNTEKEFCNLLSEYEVEHLINQQLLAREIDNLPTYGYGIKGFTLSMIETALTVTGGTVAPVVIEKIIELGRKMLAAPVTLIDQVPETLTELSARYRLIVVTKGDLLEQQRKLTKSGLMEHFHHIEVLSDKTPTQYKRLLQHLDISPESFVMVGNSLKSDILPPLHIGCQAVHIPFHTTWVHEQVSDKEKADHQYVELNRINELLTLL